MTYGLMSPLENPKKFEHTRKVNWPTKFKNFHQNVKSLKKCLRKVATDTKTLKPAPSVWSVLLNCQFQTFWRLNLTHQHFSQILSIYWHVNFLHIWQWLHKGFICTTGEFSSFMTNPGHFGNGFILSFTHRWINKKGIKSRVSRRFWISEETLCTQMNVA